MPISKPNVLLRGLNVHLPFKKGSYLREMGCFSNLVLDDQTTNAKFNGQSALPKKVN